MFAAVVVAVDGRAGGREAIALGARFADALPARLVLCHVLAYGSRPWRVNSDRAKSDARDLLAREARACDAPHELAVAVEATPASGLERVAHSLRPALVVAGSSHRGPVGRVVLGDDAASILDGATCPVVIVPRGGAVRRAAWTSLGVAYDGSHASERALKLGAELGQALGLRLRVVEVVEPTAAQSDRPRDEQASRLAHAREDLERAVARLHIPCNAEVLAGSAASELARLSTEVDLLVVGNQGRSPIGRVLSGGVTSPLIHEAACPVLVGPHPQPRSALGFLPAPEPARPARA